MRLLPIVAIAMASLSTSACLSMSRSSTMTPLSADLAAGARVSEIRLTTGKGVGSRPEFEGIFRSRVEARLGQCATGSRPLRLEASIERLDRANPVQVMVVGGANVMRGHARLVDPATGDVVGEYEIGKTIVGSRFSIFQMAESEEQLSDAFGAELCDQAFGAG